MNTTDTSPARGSWLRTEWLQVGLVGLPLLAAALVSPIATGRIPLVWGLDGKVTHDAPPSWGLFIWPSAMTVFFGVWLWMEFRDRGRLREADGTVTSHGKSVRLIRIAVAIMAASVCVAQVVCALGGKPDLGRFGPAVIPLFIAFVGNFFGKLKPNHHVGIRVPWTLASESVWRKTHRAAGTLYTSTGVAMALYGLLVGRHSALITIVWISTLIIVPLFIAWFASKSERSKHHSSF